jgi:catechol 2,3-dioxygenase-like lactoylglutathione lyase family enzyme
MSVWFRQICIRVSDLDRSMSFYKCLGFECTSLNQITNSLVEAILENPEKGGWLQLARDTTIPTPINRGDAVFKIYVYTDDCQGAYDRAITAGFKANGPPRQLDRWPYTVAYFEDPDGYTVELVQNDGDEAGRDCGYP